VKKIIAIFFLVLLLTSNAGLTLGTHFCGGHAMKSEIMLGHTSMKCGMESLSDDCALPMEAERISGSCCENDYVSMQSEEAVSGKTVIGNLNLNFTIAFAFVFGGLNACTNPEHPGYADYSPPLLKQDRAVLYQHFLL